MRVVGNVGRFLKEIWRRRVSWRHCDEVLDCEVVIHNVCLQSVILQQEDGLTGKGKKVERAFLHDKHLGCVFGGCEIALTFTFGF